MPDKWDKGTPLLLVTILDKICEKLATRKFCTIEERQWAASVCVCVCASCVSSACALQKHKMWICQWAQTKMTSLAEALGKRGNAGQSSLQFLQSSKKALGHALLPAHCGGGECVSEESGLLLSQL